jgi:hypothetical protein
LHFCFGENQTLLKMEDKNVQGYLEKLAQELNGNYTEYSDDTVIVTLPVDEGRFQSVRGLIIPKEQGLRLVLASTICRLHEYPDVDFRKMLEHNFELGYSKITITDEDYLELITSMAYELVTPEELRYMLVEVATTADKLEHEITGKDVH